MAEPAIPTDTSHDVASPVATAPTTPLGTQNIALSAALLAQAVGAFEPPAGKSVEPVEVTLQLFKELQPSNALEAMFVSQLAACHSHCTKMFKRASKALSEDNQIKYLQISERLMRCFATSVTALEKYRRGGQQSVVVEHVHVNAGGQAIVGNITRGQGHDA